ncbi:MAG: HAD family hydrolase [Oscillospiraceae bacterium]|nr:HAD family hydrolase [Oscillospiraceae bacterium]
MELEWILFDVGNTLYDEKFSEYERVISLIEKSKCGISPDEFIKQMECGAASYAASPFTYAREHLGITANYPYSSEKEVLFDGVYDMLQIFSKKYKLGILANQPSTTLERLKRDGIYDFFDICLLSETENMFKPDIAFFEYAIKKAGCSPSKIAMVGDRLDNDIMPAKKSGMKTIWIRQGLHSVQKPLSDEYTPDWEAASVGQLCCFLK